VAIEVVTTEVMETEVETGRKAATSIKRNLEEMKSKSDL
jgi:hypothetical protein